MACEMMILDTVPLWEALNWKCNVGCNEVKGSLQKWNVTLWTWYLSFAKMCKCLLTSLVLFQLDKYTIWGDKVRDCGDKYSVTSGFMWNLWWCIGAALCYGFIARKCHLWFRIVEWRKSERIAYVLCIVWLCFPVLKHGMRQYTFVKAFEEIWMAMGWGCIDKR